MRMLIGIAVLLALGLWIVMAQTGTRTPTAASTLPGTTSSAPAVSVATNETPPLKGANSFTEAQVKDRIEAAGYTQVSALLKDQDGIWRANAIKGGASVRIAFDFKGNIVAS